MPQYKIELSPQAETDFARLPKDLQRRIFSKIKFFEVYENPFAFASKLKDAGNRYRFRVGDYRIVFTPIDKNTLIILLVIKIRHRREVYE